LLGRPPPARRRGRRLHRTVRPGGGAPALAAPLFAVGQLTPPPAGATVNDTLERRVLRKVTWRLVPFLCLLYVFNILDRANVGFARLTMPDDLDMSEAVFDLAYGMFYIGYVIFEVPSNLLLRRVGARRWIARIMVSWGLVTAATLAVTGPWGFC